MQFDYSDEKNIDVLEILNIAIKVNRFIEQLWLY